MSKNTQGYMGIQVGKLGPAVGRIYRRQQVYSVYQPKVHNPRTEAQQANRMRFSVLSSLSRAFAPATAVGLKAYADSRASHYRQQFIRLNREAVTSALDPVVDYTQLLLARGPALEVDFGQPSFAKPATVEVPFDGLADRPGAAGADEVFLFAFNPAQGVGVLSDGAKRSEGTASLALPPSWSGEKAHLYGFVRNANRRSVWSDQLATRLSPCAVSWSSYIGAGTVG